MYDIFKAGVGFAVFLLILAIPDWINEYVPWAVWIITLIAAVAFILWFCNWGYERMTEEKGNEDASEETEAGHMNCRCTMYPIDF